MFSGWIGEHRSPERGRYPRLGCAGGLRAESEDFEFFSVDDLGDPDDYIFQCVDAVKRTAGFANSGSVLKVLTRPFAGPVRAEGSVCAATPTPNDSIERSRRSGPMTRSVRADRAMGRTTDRTTD